MTQTLSPAVIEARAENRAAGGIDPARLDQLAESIREVGLLQPLVVRRVVAEGTPKYQLIAGHRRLAAVLQLGLTRVECTVVEGVGAQDVEILALAENLQRQDMHPLDESDGFARLVELGQSNTAIARRVGCHRNHVASRLLLQRLIPDVRATWIREKGLSVAAARSVAQLAEPLQEKLLARTVKQRSDLRNLGTHTVTDFAMAQSDLLKDAPWSLADTRLLPEAGACTTCPKRFGYQADLFDDDEAGTPEDQRCGDRQCWKKKMAAHLDRAREKLERKGVEFAEITSGWEDKKSAIAHQRCTFVADLTPEEIGKRKVDGHTVMLWIDGANVGQITDGWVKPPAKEHDHQAEREAKIARNEARIAERLPMLTAIHGLLTDPDAEVGWAPLKTDTVLERIAEEASAWNATSALIRARGGQPDEHGRLDYELRDGAEKAVAALPPLRQVLLLLAAADLDPDDRRGPDLLVILHGLLVGEEN